MKNILPLIFILAQIFLHGCSTTQTRGRFIDTSLSSQQIKHALNQQHLGWKGVRYKMGGTTRNGVDCSGFIYRTFKDGIGVNIPRSTALQSKLGKPVDKDDLQAGDLIFFKTGSVFKSNHVGVYTGNNSFLHASTSKGVIKSNLNNPYWKDVYWHSRRILK